MPFVQLPSHDDYVSIWYITNSAYGNVGSFDPEKPTVVVLHPLFLDSSWLTKHFDDPRLSSEYNLIAFDQRTQGRSRCRPSALHDVSVDAADLAATIQVRLVHERPCPFHTNFMNRHFVYLLLISLLSSVYPSILSYGSLRCAYILVAARLQLTFFKVARACLESHTL